MTRPPTEAACFSERFFAPVVSKGLFEASQLTGEKKPAFGSGDEALAVLVVAVGFCQFFFGNRATLGRCKETCALRSPCKIVCNRRYESESCSKQDSQGLKFQAPL